MTGSFWSSQQAKAYTRDSDRKRPESLIADSAQGGFLPWQRLDRRRAEKQAKSPNKNSTNCQIMPYTTRLQTQLKGYIRRLPQILSKRGFGPTKHTDYPPSPGYGAAGTNGTIHLFSLSLHSFASFRVFSGQFNPSSLSLAHKRFKNPRMTADATAYLGSWNKALTATFARSTYAKEMQI